MKVKIEICGDNVYGDVIAYPDAAQIFDLNSLDNLKSVAWLEEVITNIVLKANWSKDDFRDRRLRLALTIKEAISKGNRLEVLSATVGEESNIYLGCVVSDDKGTFNSFIVNVILDFQKELQNICSIISDN